MFTEDMIYGIGNMVGHLKCYYWSLFIRGKKKILVIKYCS